MGRLFGFLSVILAMAAGLYIYSRQAQSTSAAAGGNNPKAAIDITAVRSDLMTIAQAERGYFALEGKYASLDELVSSRALSVARQRPPYSYELETSGSGFRVIASRTVEDNAGTPAQISVDENMQFHTSQ
ncbi:MAG TPA: hypothetical protein VFA67_12755 [Candidatus Sulfotelmatobacter sp.]|nr:hypothetical protein [Candidatus Sulfotelmatobacter sp.]